MSQNARVVAIAGDPVDGFADAMDGHADALAVVAATGDLLDGFRVGLRDSASATRFWGPGR